MFAFPPVPSFDGLHPLIVHFPIALLLLAPVFVAAGTVRRLRAPALAGALVLMSLGTIAVWIAVPTGEAAGELADRTRNIEGILEQHEELAETTRTLFTILTLVFAAILLVPRRIPRIAAIARPWTLAGFLVAYAVSALVLVNTAHQGARLVHEYGIHAMIETSGGTPAASEGATSPAIHDEDDAD